jgi:hypothetical protein
MRLGSSTIMNLMLLILAAAVCNACDGLGMPINGDTVHEEVFIPYLEEASVPNTMIVGQASEVSVRFSAALKPELLTSTGYVWDGTGGAKYPGGDFSHAVDERAFHLLAAEHSAGQPVDEIKFDLTPAHPGTYTLRIGSTKSRETGGSSIVTTVIPSFLYPVGKDPFVYREYVIEVLPAP